MVLTGASVLVVECAPQSGCHPRLSKGSPSCLLPLWETLQDQQVGLTQAPFKFLPLFWDSKHMRFCMYPKD